MKGGIAAHEHCLLRPSLLSLVLEEEIGVSNGLKVDVEKTMRRTVVIVSHGCRFLGVEETNQRKIGLSFDGPVTQHALPDTKRLTIMTRSFPVRDSNSSFPSESLSSLRCTSPPTCSPAV
jgi:hypothetical protein